jgi:NAD(P)-dependent dehydrogenase (short-subunit alcohol dehydrogenase family)
MRAEDLYRVSDKVVVVTGGANGLGFAIARAMSDNGAKVVILDADRPSAEQAATRLSSRGGKVRAEAVDVTDATAMRSAFDRVLNADGGFDVVFANAEIAGGPGFLTPLGSRDPAGEIENIPNALWERLLGVNLHGIFRTIQCAVPHLKKRGRGRIIVTTSVAAAKTSPYSGVPYAATKAAVAHLVRQLALELARFGVTVNAIQPGPFQGHVTLPDFLPLMEQSLPTRRVGRTEEIEGLALFFASDASSFVTGAQYNIDGGELLGPAD